MGVAANLVMAAALVVTAWPSLFAAFDPTRIDVVHRLQPPGGTHPFGTDELGRDLLSRVRSGVRLSLTASLAVVLISAAVGIPVGMVAGYLGGRVDSLLMRIADILIAFPFLIMAMAIVTVIGPGCSTS